MPRPILRAVLPTEPRVQQLLGCAWPWMSISSQHDAPPPHTHTHSSHSPGPSGPALTPMCPLQSWGSSRARQSLRSLSTGPGPPGTGASLLPLAPAGAGLGPGALWEDSGRGQPLELHLPVPPSAPALLRAPGSRIKGLDAEQGHEGAGAEGAGGVEVGVVGCPASHDLLVVHQRVTGTAQRAARQQNLPAKTWEARRPAWAPSPPPPSGTGRGGCVPAVCTGGAILTSREGGWQDPGVSLRCSEEWRRLRPLTEDSERSHSLPREAELCHYVRKHGQPAPCPCLPGCWLRPPLGPLWHAAFAAPQP